MYVRRIFRLKISILLSVKVLKEVELDAIYFRSYYIISSNKSLSIYLW
jgi:hypothetical protein